MNKEIKVLLEVHRDENFIHSGLFAFSGFQHAVDDFLLPLIETLEKLSNHKGPPMPHEMYEGMARQALKELRKKLEQAP